MKHLIAISLVLPLLVIGLCDKKKEFTLPKNVGVITIQQSEILRQIILAEYEKQPSFFISQIEDFNSRDRVVLDSLRNEFYLVDIVSIIEVFDMLSRLNAPVFDEIYRKVRVNLPFLCGEERLVAFEQTTVPLTARIYDLPCITINAARFLSKGGIWEVRDLVEKTKNANWCSEFKEMGADEGVIESILFSLYASSFTGYECVTE